MRVGRLLIAPMVACAASIGVAQAVSGCNHMVTDPASNQPQVAPVLDSKLVNGSPIAADASTASWLADNGTRSGAVFTGTSFARNQNSDPVDAYDVLTDPDSVDKGIAIIGGTLHTSDFCECEVDIFEGTFSEFETSETRASATVTPRLPSSQSATRASYPAR